MREYIGPANRNLVKSQKIGFEAKTDTWKTCIY